MTLSARMPTFLLALILCLGGGQLRAQEQQNSLRSHLEAIDASDSPSVFGEALHHFDEVAAIYEGRNHEPLWTPEGPLASAAQDLIAAIEASEGHGFNRARYHHRLLVMSLGGEEDVPAAAFDLLMTDAFLSQARDRATGVVGEFVTKADWHLPRSEVDAPALLAEIIQAPRSLVDELDALWPASDEYRALVECRQRIQQLPDTSTPPIPPGRPLKPGMVDDRVSLLKARLLGPGDHDSTFDDELKSAVVAFQNASGIETDATVGPATLEILNATRFDWIDRIDVNLERWRWLPRVVPATYLRVNIAAFALRLIENHGERFSSNVITGRSYRQTPVFTADLKYLVIHPYWNVPRKLAIQDKLPLLLKDSEALAAFGYEVRLPGTDAFVPVDAVSWEGMTGRRFDRLLRQRPGPANALGEIKFMLPNPYDVYLHDTPEKALFGKRERPFSSGCIRLEEPRELAAVLLKVDKNREGARLGEYFHEPQTRTIYLNQPLPVFLVYFTAFVDASGEIVFRRDIYGRDAALLRALREAP